MSVPAPIQVFDFTGCPFAVSVAAGQRVRNQIAPLLREGKHITLSFAGIETIIATSLSAAVSLLLSEFPEEQIRGLLVRRDIREDNRAFLNCVIRYNKVYSANLKSFDDMRRAELGDDVSQCTGLAQPLRCRTELKEGGHHA